MTDSAEGGAEGTSAVAPLILPPMNLPPPKPLVVDDNLASNWKQWKKVWQRYEIATGIYKQENLVRVSTLLSVIGEEAVKAFDTFAWGEGQSENSITDVLAKFDEYCEPRTQVIYERYRFNNRKQEPGESISAYVTELRVIAKNCAHDEITPDEILRDRLVLGVRDEKVRERLLRVNDLTLSKAIDICKAAEQTSQQLKLLASGTEESVGAVRTQQRNEPPQNTRRPRDPPIQRTECRFCGYQHGNRQCPAKGQTCHKCGQKNHFQSRCRATNPKVNTVEEVPEEVFRISKVGSRSRALITMEVGMQGNQSQVTFQLDTGAECNLISLKDYQRATGDVDLAQVKRCSHKFIKTYTNERYKILGSTELPTWRHEKRNVLPFNITKDDLGPLLSYSTCIGLGLITINDCDSPSNVSSLEDTPSVGIAVTVGIADILEEYKDVFEGLGDLPGEHHIVTDDTVPPVVHPPRRVPVALRNQIKEKLDEMVTSGILAPVTEPTEWVSSMLVIVKPNKLRICLDPRDLNKAIRREHYQMPTVEEVATRLSQAKKFTVVDAKDGFWQKRLDTESSYKTTFNTPFGRYRWNRMPFGISSAPEVWQRTMHEFVEDLEGVEVIADDFLIAGFGNTEHEVNQSLARNERAFLEKCRLWNLKLNRAKVKWHQSSVKFMGHLLTSQGLMPDPEKIQAILQMPEPEDVTSLKRFLGMVTYLAKFMPHLSEMTEPLRRLEDKNVEFQWLEQHSLAMKTIKKFLTEAPVLRYYDINKPVTVQCDASQSGLGAVLLQDGQPVCYASRALTDTESRYAQIEKEMLAITWACDKFDQYLYGRDKITVETDHEPLKSVFKKEIHKSPKRLQRMRLALQKYNLEVQYKKGTLMHIADALSRAYLETTDGAQTEFCEIRALEMVNHEEYIRVEPPKRDVFRQRVAEDADIQELIRVIKQGWPEKKNCPPAAQPYYDERGELIESQGLVFRGEQLVVPVSLRKEMLNQLHSSHIGIGGCVRRAREILYWPRMSAEIRDFVSRCTICQTYRPEQAREGLQPHELPSRPWQKIGADLFVLGQQTFLIMVDYWSNFFEVVEIHKKTAQAVITQLKVQFARHGIPEVLITDNGSEFDNREFQSFSSEWNFDHRTSSPRYPQSNGKVENAVKTCKGLLMKAKDDKKDPLLAILDWRNTPSEGFSTSPVQRLMGRRTRTLLPTAAVLLRPNSDIKTTASNLAARKRLQCKQYNRGIKNLAPLKAGDSIRMKLPGEKKWSLGHCTRPLARRSYEVEVEGRRFRRNRRQLRSTMEPSPEPCSPIDEPHQAENESKPPDLPEFLPGQIHTQTPEIEVNDSIPATESVPVNEDPIPAFQPRRSERARRAPAWLEDYDLNT